MKTTGFAATDVGQKRDHNEDSHIIDEQLGLYAVADGMGGHKAGEVASKMALDILVEHLTEHSALIDGLRSEPERTDDLAPVMAKAVELACARIHEDAQEHPDRAGMGTTLTALVTLGTKAVMAHVGDSRLYLFRDGEHHQLSVDHTMVNELLKAGVLTRAEAVNHPYSNILTRTVGTRPAVHVDTLVFDVMPRDTLLLCSDGLSGPLAGTEDQIAELLGADDPSGAPAILVDRANAAGGPDNITALVVQVPAKASHESPRSVDVTKRRLETLVHTTLGHNLRLAARTRLLSACTPERWNAGELLAEAGQHCHQIWIVAEGTLTLTPPSGPPIEVNRGGCVGAGTLLKERRCRATLSTSTEVSLLSLDGPAFARLARVKPRTGVTMMRNIANQLSEALLDPKQPDHHF